MMDGLIFCHPRLPDDDSKNDLKHLMESTLPHKKMEAATGIFFESVLTGGQPGFLTPSESNLRTMQHMDSTAGRCPLRKGL